MKIIGLSKNEFDELINNGEIQLREAHLIPNIKPGDELALASVILSSIKLIKEFGRMIFTDIKMLRSGKINTFNEVVFDQYPESRVDGMIIIVQGGVIKDAAIFEMKNGSSELNKEQMERYIKIAKSYGIPKIVTISNQFVSEPTQFPIDVKTTKHVDLYHFSWSYLLTLAHILLFENKINIEDKDQIEIMKEVVSYLEHDKSGVCGFNQMKSGWKEVIEKINTGTRIKIGDKDLFDTIVSWEQEEKDLALILSRKLGVFVGSGEAKYKGDLKARIDDDKKMLIDKKLLISNLKVPDAVSDIKIEALFDKRTIEMSVTVNAPQDKKIRGQLNWIKRQIEKCRKKNEEDFTKIQNEIIIEIVLKNTSKTERVCIDSIDKIYDEIKDKEVKEFKVLYIKDFGKRFASCRKFVEILEEMLVDYYSIIVQFLSNWTPPAPKIIEEQEVKEKEYNKQKKMLNKSKIN